MTTVSLTKAIPAFTASATSERTITQKSLKGQITVIYFYPKDNTPGCTQEGQDFRDMHAKFKRAGCEILGVSRDSLRTHENFKAKHEFPFDLIADTDEEFCTLFDVIKMKNMYGKQVRGIERSTFLIDDKGKLAQEWRKVKVKGHVEEVLAAVKAL